MGLRKKLHYIWGPAGRRQHTQHRVPGGHQGGQEAEAGGGESPGHSPYWGFHGTGRAGKHEQLSIGYLEEFQRGLSCRVSLLAWHLALG